MVCLVVSFNIILFNRTNNFIANKTHGFSSEFLTKKYSKVHLSCKSLFTSSTFLFLAVKFTEVAIAAKILLSSSFKQAKIDQERKR